MFSQNFIGNSPLSREKLPWPTTTTYIQRFWEPILQNHRGLQHWRAILSRSKGSLVSSNVAPATATASVVSNKSFALAYKGRVDWVGWGISRVGWNVWYKAFGVCFFIGGNLFSCFPNIFVLMGSYMDQCMGVWKIAAYIHLWFGGLEHVSIFYPDPCGHDLIWLAQFVSNGLVQPPTI